MTTSDDGTPTEGQPPVPPSAPVPPDATNPVGYPPPPPGYPPPPPVSYPPPPGYPPPPPGAYPPPASGYADYGPFAGKPKTSGLAIASLVCGIVGLCLCGLVAIVGLILGLQARKEIGASGGAKSGDGLAIAGIVVSALSIVVWLAWLAFAFG